ncbi:OprD family porin [Stutzerimonas stutzeri]|uniref:OprD family porin n=1 Tax=Stutzerimonas stutzeri TaxID=316 RepID=UPI00215951AD
MPTMTLPGRGLALGLLLVPAAAIADFFEDSKQSLELRNFYMNRDYRDATDSTNTRPPKLVNKDEFRSKSEEWAQGVILRYESGFTEGTFGLGVDAIAGLGIRLDSGRGRSDTQLLQIDRSEGRAERSYGDLGLTAKARVAESVLRVGTLMPRLPSVSANLEGRLLPQSFQGAQLTSTDIDGLSFNLGHLNRINQRYSSDHEPMTLNNIPRGMPVNKAGRFSPGKVGQSDSFDFASFSYRWNPGLTTAYNVSRLEGLYRQHILNGVHVLPLGEGRSLRTDLRLSRSSDDGGTNVDNKAFSGMLSYAFGHTRLGVSYQKMTGDTGYVYINGTDPFLVNYSQVRDFANKDEKSWQLRYDYDFAGLGIPGLSLFTRYVSGHGVDRGPDQSSGREWERDFDVTYVVQNGPLKNLSLRWRNTMIRSNFFRDLDENRLIVGYRFEF